MSERERMRRRARLWMLGRYVLVAMLVAACAGPGPVADVPAEQPRNPAELEETGTYSPNIDYRLFVHRIDNPYLPLIPGTILSYEGLSDGERETEKFVVTNKTKTILGIRTTAVRDQVFIAGELVEDTFDWFAQDRFGNVWYFGESSHDIENGKVVSTKGSWEAGVDGALPGVVMLGTPQLGDSYRQEFYEGEAEDVAKIIELQETVKVPFGSFEEVLVTEDMNPLEPRFLENKFYAPGVGVVLERLVEGGKGYLELVDVSTP